MKWFKFYGQDWMTDMKVIGMSVEDRLCFITLLCLASSADEGGLVRNCSEDTLIALTHLYENPYDSDNEVSRARGCLERFEASQIVTRSRDGDVTVLNFMSRQAKNQSDAERARNYRKRRKERVKEEEKTVTPSRDERHARIDKKRIDISDSTNRKVNSKNMGWKSHNENDHTDDIPSIDADSGEKIRDKADEQKEENKKIGHNLGILGEARGKKFLDIPTQRSFYIRLLKAGLTHRDIGKQFMDLVDSSYWVEKKKQGQLPDLKSLYSIVKNKT